MARDPRLVAFQEQVEGTIEGRYSFDKLVERNIELRAGEVRKTFEAKRLPHPPLQR